MAPSMTVARALRTSASLVGCATACRTRSSSSASQEVKNVVLPQLDARHAQALGVPHGPASPGGAAHQDRDVPPCRGRVPIRASPRAPRVSSRAISAAVACAAGVAASCLVTRCPILLTFQEPETEFCDLLTVFCKRF